MAIRYVDLPPPKPEPEPYKLKLPQARHIAGTPEKERKHMVKKAETATKAKRTFDHQPTYTVSADLAPIVGGQGHITRAQVVSKLWAYIKAKNLQSGVDKRMIYPDETLARVLGDKPVNMMGLQGKISPHLIKATASGGPLDAGKNG